MNIIIRSFQSTCLLLILSAILVDVGVADDKLDQYGGWKAIKGTKTGFFHVEKSTGVIGSSLLKAMRSLPLP